MKQLSGKDVDIGRLTLRLKWQWRLYKCPHRCHYKSLSVTEWCTHDKPFNEGICSVEGKVMSYELRQSIKADMRNVDGKRRVVERAELLWVCEVSGWLLQSGTVAHWQQNDTTGEVTWHPGLQVMLAHSMWSETFLCYLWHSQKAGPKTHKKILCTSFFI